MSAEIQSRARLAVGFFPFEVKPVPATPTHCRGCKAPLELTRRYAGLCKTCVAKRSKRCRRGRPPLKVLREFVQRGEKFIEVQCGCGARRVMRLATYKARRPQSCKRCRVRDVARNGFEAEYAR